VRRKRLSKDVSKLRGDAGVAGAVEDSGEQDLEDLYAYIAESDSLKSTDDVFERLFEVTENLAASPELGSQPKVLRSPGIQEYRQVFFKPYWVIYRVLERQVVINVIADGRRDVQSLLSRRLLGG
jgi:toxin ParE1/3/4